MIEISWSPTYAEFREAVQLDRRVNLSNRIFHLFMAWFAPAFGIFSVLVFALLRPFTGVHVHISFMAWVIVAMTLLAPFYERRTIRNQFRNMFPARAAERTFRAEIGDDGILIAVPGGAQTKYVWSMFIRTIRGNKVILFYVNKTRFLFIPLSALNADQHLELNNLMAARLVTKGC